MATNKISTNENTVQQNPERLKKNNNNWKISRFLPLFTKAGK